MNETNLFFDLSRFIQKFQKNKSHSKNKLQKQNCYKKLKIKMKTNLKFLDFF